MKKASEPKSKQQPVPLGRLNSWHVTAILTLLVAFFFRDILLQKAFFWEDFMYQYYAFRNFAAVSLAHGSLPLWNPYTYNGMPFQADIQTALFYIPNLLLTLFVSGDKLYFLWVEVLIIAHYVVAGFGLYLFMRELGLERPYALFAGVAFAFSGFMIVQVIHETFVCQVAWSPLLLLFFRRTLRKKSPFWMIVTGLVLGHAILAGSPQFTLYILLLLLGYFLFEAWPVFRTSGFAPFALAATLAAGVIVIAFGLTALQLLPTQEMGTLSQRAEISFDKSSEGSLQFQQIITLLVPKYFGSSGAQGSTFWLGTNYWEYWETCIYLGLVPFITLCAALFLLRRERYVAFFAGVMLFGLLYSLGNNFIFHSLFFHLVPGFDKFRVPGRMSYYVTLGASVLSGFGLRYLMTSGGSEKKIMRFLLSMIACGLLVWIIGQAGLFQPAGDERAYGQIHPMVTTAVSTSLVLLLVACGLFIAFRKKMISAATLVVLILVFHFVDMNMFGFDQNNGPTNPEDYYSRGSDIVTLIREEGKTELFRFNSRSGGAMLIDRNQGMIDRIFTCEGYTPLALQRNYPVGRFCYDLLNAKYRVGIDTIHQTMGLRKSESYFPRAFLVNQARILPDEKSETAYMEGESFRPAGEVLLEEDPHFAVPPADSLAPGRATITSYDLNEIRIDASTRRNAYLVVSEIYYPGWHADVDGTDRKIYRADYCLRAIPLEAGEHHIDLRFEPASFRRGAAITGVTLILALAGGWFSYRREHRPPPPQPSS